MVDVRPFWIRKKDDDLLADVDRERRLTLAVIYLRSGDDLSQELRDAIADLIEDAGPMSKGRPNRPPLKWHEIGVRLSDGQETQQTVADALNLDLKAVYRGNKYYKEAIKLYEEFQREVLEEQMRDLDDKN